MVDQEYIKKRWAFKKNLYHLLLGVMQCIQKPLLLILLFPIFGITFFAFENRDTVKELIDMPEILSPVWDVIINTYCITIPVVLILLLFSGTGELVSRKDEALMQTVFTKQLLRSGYPILMKKYKRKDGVTVRIFYTPICFNDWIDRREAICDIFSVHYVGEGLRYEEGSRVVMFTQKGRKLPERGDIYDEEF